MGHSYLLLGPEKGLKEDAIKNIRSQIGQCDVSKFYAFEDYEAELFAQLNNNDLFAVHKLVILDEVQDLKTAEKIKPLVQFIQNPSDCATLVMTSTELYVNSALMGAVEAQGKDYVLKFYELFESKKNEWLSNYFRRNGLSIDNKAITAIIEKVENNVQEFENTCSQMVIFLKTMPDKQSVTYEDVEEFLTHTREESEFTLFAFIARGKLESALECLHTLLRTKDSASVSSLCASRLSSYFRRALSVQINVSNGCGMSLRYGEDNTAFSKKVFEGDRPISMPKDREIYRDCCSTYSQRDIERILVTLAEYDVKIKETPVVLQSIMLERCIMDVICRKGRHGRTLEFAKL
ncbi:MAG: DNA polymerase III subunit delta [Spirochaetales bacterium]|nr:DNA polymerase III subunit delta [Spirochaetales bacterium]